MPALNPVTTQDGELVEPAMVIAAPAALQRPPVVPSLNVVVLPTHMPVAPVIAAMGFTVIILFTAQLPKAYVIIAVPALTPVILQDSELVEPTVAAPEQLHMPPVMPSVSVIEFPLHTAPAPDMAVGVAFTVTVALAAQPPTI